NGDGYPDLLVHKGGANNRDDLDATPPTIYKNLLLNVPSGAGRAFKDITQESGFTAIRGGGKGRASHFGIFADVNNDGYLDAFSGTYVDASPTAQRDPGDRNEILLGDGKGGFTLAPKSGIFHKEMYTTTSASFLDYNKDGNVDIFVGYFYEIYGFRPANQDRLYKGNGDGTFVDVTDEMGLTTERDSGFEQGTNSRPTYGVTACDVDGDGDADLMVSAYARQWNMLWRNDGTKFVDVSKESGFAGDDIVDYTDSEFYKCYCKESKECSAEPPTINCDRYDWIPGVDDQPWRNNGNTFTTVCGDFDNDGDMDLFNGEIRHWHIGSSSDPSQMLVNIGEKPLRFERPGNAVLGLERIHVTTNWNEGDISAAMFDFDGDGLQEVIVMDSDYPDTHTLLFHQKPDHTFEEISQKAGIAHDRGQEVSVADLDGDGDLDVIMGTSTMRNEGGGPKIAQVHVYENQVGNLSNWIKVRLIGSGKDGANRAAIGAWVFAHTGGTRQLREASGGYGVLGVQNDLVVHFGLGKACNVDKLEVLWPDKTGSKSVFADVRANYTVEIDQKSDQLRYVTP
ncbi:MAG: CRTAC1 family protein, partial [Pseudomonadota bacterium]